MGKRGENRRHPGGVTPPPYAILWCAALCIPAVHKLMHLGKGSYPGCAGATGARQRRYRFIGKVTAPVAGVGNFEHRSLLGWGFEIGRIGRQPMLLEVFANR